MTFTPLARLGKLVHRLSDDDQAEAEAAFHRLRSHCRRHKMKMTDFRLVPTEAAPDSLLDRYLAVIDRLWDGDPRMHALQRENEELRRQLQNRKSRAKVRSPSQEMVDG